MQKYYLEKEKNVKPNALLKTTCSKQSYILSGLVDAAILVVPLFLLYFYPVLPIYIAILVIQFGLLFLGGGKSIGKLLFNIRYINQDTYKLLKWTDFLIYTLESFFDHWKMNDDYVLFSKLFDRYHQSAIDKEYGILLVNKKHFRLFIKQHKDI